MTKRIWVFSCLSKDKKGNKIILKLLKPSFTELVRYIKIKGQANPFDTEYKYYFEMRRRLINNVPIKQSNANISTVGI